MKRYMMEAALVTAIALCASALRAEVSTPAEKIVVSMGRAYLLDSPVDIERIAIVSPEVAESVPVSNRSVMINGKSPGETSAVVWLSNGTRKEYDVTVLFSATRLEAAKLQIQKEFDGNVELTGDNSAVYLTGKVKNIFESERAVTIGSTIGKVVNLLKVEVPAQEQQVLLRVKFADVDRSKSMSLGANVLGTPGGYPFNVTTGTSPSRFTQLGNGTTPSTINLSDAMNILMFDPHANILTTIQALQANNVLQILAEPNLLAMNGHLASFVAGGEFPYPYTAGRRIGSRANDSAVS